MTTTLIHIAGDGCYIIFYHFLGGGHYWGSDPGLTHARWPLCFLVISPAFIPCPHSWKWSKIICRKIEVTLFNTKVLKLACPWPILLVQVYRNVMPKLPPYWLMHEFHVMICISQRLLNRPWREAKDVLKRSGGVCVCESWMETLISGAAWQSRKKLEGEVRRSSVRITTR